ncbi:hypothetical protein SFRURICE_014451 [Spodoptera frugiperda]|uniref:SFRICE_007414 n=1 Tax=Spodoptera frugiperda TaxID=7108 RepID=A0A2H1WCS5_SPOFR|nr:hypothetical protein SFRURICE_014451 [Spodoptera frugiperda]
MPDSMLLLRTFRKTEKSPAILCLTQNLTRNPLPSSRTCDHSTTDAVNCVHLQLYKDLKERQKNGQTKASLSLQQYLGIESGFTLDKESNTLAILCEDVVPVLAFDTREILIQWRVKVQHNLGGSKEFAAVIISSPTAANIRAGPVRLHACGPRLALCASRPPEVLALWDVKLLR